MNKTDRKAMIKGRGFVTRNACREFSCENVNALGRVLCRKRPTLGQKRPTQRLLRVCARDATWLSARGRDCHALFASRGRGRGHSSGAASFPEESNDQVRVTRDRISVKRDHASVTRDRICVKRNRFGVKRDHTSVQRDLINVKRDLIGVKRDHTSV